MSPLELFLAALSAVGTSLACGWAFVRMHRHPEHPTREEMDAELGALRALLDAHHEAVLRELTRCTNAIESLRSSRR